MTSKALIEEIYSKVGRNILLFQKLEFVIKYLVSISDINFNKNKTNQKNAIQMANDMKLTLGTVVGKYFETYNRDSLDDPVELDGESLYFRLSRTCSVDFLEDNKKVLADMVAERNDLVHGSLQEFQLDSSESCEAFIKKLDIQYEKVDKLMNEFLHVTKTTQKYIEQVIEYLTSEEYKNNAMKNNRIFHQLCYISTQIQRSDGWTVMSTAINHLDLEPDELDLLKKQYGHTSYKKKMLATDLFDF